MNVFIDNFTYIIKEDLTILETCKLLGIKIPHFCYHETLSISGNCRMCLIKLEFDGDKKREDDLFVISCLTTVLPLMEIIVEDPFVYKLREEILEFLLINHPLDCPICDQGGECDLQDLVKKFGSDKSKFYFNKRGVEDNKFSVFINSILTRCIHCTRCVRFNSEISGLETIGMLNRGKSSEIGTFVKENYISEISANVIDLCPVGALTSKDYKFQGRQWKLINIESIDLTDGFGSNIYVSIDSNNKKVEKVLPKYNAELNGSIITDKARFYFDCESQLKFSSEFQNLINISDIESNESKTKINFAEKKILFICSDDLKFEEFNYLNKLSNSNVNFKISVRSLFQNNLKNSSNFFFNNSKTLDDINPDSEACFILGVNPKVEGALINTRLRALSLNNYLQVYNIGLNFVSTIKSLSINLNINYILKLLEGKLLELSFLLIDSYAPLIILGSSVKERGLNIKSLEIFLKKLNFSTVVFDVFLSSNSASSTYLNIKSVNLKDIYSNDVIFFINTRDSSFVKKLLLFTNKDFYWYNAFLPIKNLNKYKRNVYTSSLNFERTGIYLNTEFRPQLSNGLSSASSNIVDEFIVFLASKFMPLNYNRSCDTFIKELIYCPENFLKLSHKKHSDFFFIMNFVINKMAVDTYPIKSQIKNFYQTNSYTDNSQKMQDASLIANYKENFFFSKSTKL